MNAIKIHSYLSGECMKECYNKKEKEDACNQMVGGGKANKKKDLRIETDVRVKTYTITS